MVAAYRFFDNDKVTFENVLAPHIESSYRRVDHHRIVLLVQDTTELDLTRPHSEMQGVGRLQNGRRSGAHLHLLHAFATDGTPLGTLAAECWTRDNNPSPDEAKQFVKKPKRTATEKKVHCSRRPLEEKETYRWLTTAQHCAEIKSHCPNTQLVMVADQESDITEVIDYCRSQQDFDWIVRGDATRVLHRENKGETSVTVREALLATKALFRRELTIRERHSWGSATVKHRPGKADRRAREVTVTVHAGQVTINDPRPYHPDGVTVNAVLVREVDPGERMRRSSGC
jgi:hypothetical protein